MFTLWLCSQWIGPLEKAYKCHSQTSAPFKCSHCDYAASRSGNLKHHINSVHKHLRPFKCSHCDYVARQSYTLKKHTSSVHKHLHPFKCSHCDYAASQSDHLKHHINSVHKRLHPLKCSHCDYSASHSGNMKKHTSSVHNHLHLFKCSHCAYAASQSGNLKQQINNVHQCVLYFASQGAEMLEYLHVQVSSISCRVVGWSAHFLVKRWHSNCLWLGWVNTPCTVNWLPNGFQNFIEILIKLPPPPPEKKISDPSNLWNVVLLPVNQVL